MDKQFHFKTIFEITKCFSLYLLQFKTISACANHQTGGVLCYEEQLHRKVETTSKTNFVATHTSTSTSL